MGKVVCCLSQAISSQLAAKVVSRSKTTLSPSFNGWNGGRVKPSMFTGRMSGGSWKPALCSAFRMPVTGASQVTTIASKPADSARRMSFNVSSRLGWK